MVRRKKKKPDVSVDDLEGALEREQQKTRRLRDEIDKAIERMKPMTDMAEFLGETET